MKRRTVRNQGHWAALAGLSLSIVACGNGNGGAGSPTPAVTDALALPGTQSGSSTSVASPSSMASAPSASATLATTPGSGGSVVPSAPTNPIAAGTSSTVASAATSAPPAVVDPALIDDFEDGNATILSVAGRSGQWTAYNDATAGGTQTPKGSATPAAGGANSSGFALHTTGSGFTSWGAGVQLDFNNTGGGASSRMPFNASAYQGVSFYAKGSGAVRVELPTLATTDSAGGGTCTTDCLNSHGQSITLTADWTLITVPFAKVAQEDWGTPAAFDAGTLLGLAFKVPGSSDAPATFDFWIDDLKFASTVTVGEDPPPVVVPMESSSVPGKCGDIGTSYNNNGSVTYYTFAMGSKEVNCSYAITGSNPDKVAHIATGGYFGAMNTTDYNNSGMCGSCVEVTRDGNRKVVITIVDQCPVATNPKCQKGHIDLSVAAFDQLGNRGNEGYLGTGNGGQAGSISWKYVPCPTTENISFRLKEPDNKAWNQLLVQGHKYPLKSVTINGKEGARQAYNYWEPPDGKMGSAPYEVKLTDVNGGVVTAWIEPKAGDIDSGQQQTCQ